MEAPNLQLQWLEADQPIIGTAGEVHRLRFVLANGGMGGAFAALLAAHTNLGPVGAREWVHPGPPSGARLIRTIELTLESGMERLCIEAILQRLSAAEPQETGLDDNRTCVPIQVQAQRSTKGKSDNELPAK
ncbi:MAG TPA: hypothetical protein VGB99_17925 [Acidobacteriota bacterium]